MTSRRPRVLVLHTHPVQYLAPLFRRYATEAGIELTVAYCHVPDSDAGMFDPDYGIRTPWGVNLLEGYEFVRLPSLGNSSRCVNPAVIGLIRRERFDLVVAYGYNFLTSWFSLMGAKIVGARWVFVSDNFTTESQGGRRRPWKGTFLRVLDAIGVGVIAQSTRSRNFYARFFKRVVLVPHAIDDRHFAPSARGADDGVEYDGNRTVFLYVGKLIKRKRVEDAIAAVSALPDAVLWIVGVGPEEEKLRLAASAASDRIRFLGFKDQTQLPNLYAAADALVLPSAVETFGLVVSEAASVGVPSVVSDACGVVDSLVTQGVTGEVFAHGDVEDLVAAMRRLMNDEYRRHLRLRLATRFEQWTADANVRAFGAAIDAFVRAGR